MSLTAMKGVDAQHHQAPAPQLGAMPQPAQASIIARLLSMAGKVTFGSFALVMVLVAADAFLPPDYRPTTLMGRFPGRLETAEILAKQDAAIAYLRQQVEAQAAAQIEIAKAQAKAQEQMQIAIVKEQAKAQEQMQIAVAQAQARAQSNAQIETQLAQAQLQNRAESLQAQQGLAVLADTGCMLSGLMESSLGRNDPFAQLAKAGCGTGNQLRDGMTGSLAATAQQGSGLYQRPSADGQGTGQPPAMTALQARDQEDGARLKREQADRDAVTRQLLANTRSQPEHYEPFDRYGRPVQPEKTPNAWRAYGQDHYSNQPVNPPAQPVQATAPVTHFIKPSHPNQPRF